MKNRKFKMILGEVNIGFPAVLVLEDGQIVRVSAVQDIKAGRNGEIYIYTLNTVYSNEETYRIPCRGILTDNVFIGNPVVLVKENYEMAKTSAVQNFLKINNTIFIFTRNTTYYYDCNVCNSVY